MLDDSKREDKNLNSGEKNDSPEKPDIDEDSYHDEDIFPLAESIVRIPIHLPNLQELFPSLLNTIAPFYNMGAAQADKKIINGSEPLKLTKYLAYKVINQGSDITDITLLRILSKKTDSNVFKAYDDYLNIIEEVKCAILQFESCPEELIYSVEKEQINLLNNYPSVLYFIEREYDKAIKLNKDESITGNDLVIKMNEELGRLIEMRGQLEIKGKTLKEKIDLMNDSFINNSFSIDSNDDVDVSYSSTRTDDLDNITGDITERKIVIGMSENKCTEDNSSLTKKTKLPRKIKKSITKEITPERAVMYLGTIKKCRVTNNIRASCFEDAKIHGEDQRNYYGAFHEVYRKKFNFSYGQMEESLKDLIKQSKKKSKKMGNFNN